MVNIKDVARVAGVSIASVSRVLSGSPGVGEDTAKRIRKIVDELGYKPNLGARGLVKRQTGNIAVALRSPNFSSLPCLPLEPIWLGWANKPREC